MSTAVDELVYPLTQKHSLKDCSVAALQQMAEEHPYFTAIHLLLTKKMEEEQDVHFSDQRSKTSLYFPDPLWLDRLLHEKPTLLVDTGMRAKPKEVHVFEPAFTSKRTVAVEIPVAVANTHDHITEEIDTIEEEGNMAEESQPLSTTTTFAEQAPATTNGSDEMRLNAEEDHPQPITTTFEEEAPVTASGPDELRINTGENQTLSTTIEEKAPDTTNGFEEKRTIAEEDAVSQDNTKTMKTPTDELPATESAAVPAPEPARSKSTEPVVSAAGSEILFEPFHTVDYFASQGIKFTEEEKPADKLGQQLKSFTEWLKTLRKTPDKEISIPVNLQTEQKVEKLAAHSLADREVVTEAMAEVWEKQGNKEKARAIYHKLSLLNPSKRSYFAAKIELLKNS